MRGGFRDDEMYFKSRLPSKDNRDVLGEFLPLAKKANIRTIAKKLNFEVEKGEMRGTRQELREFEVVVLEA